MKVTVKLIGHLIQKVGFSEKDVEISPGATVSQLIESLGIPGNSPMIITVGGQGVPPEHPLKEGDRLVISHVYSGG
ncbi:MAG: MoaD/ThiS family protein [Coprothermobacterota bacterium]|jgi:sulfur carrier protein ThiS|nr:MoaD/ThiS family protein [Caldisericota bacterium]MDI6868242.1 MoaD/ThiS family protein [Coprothermobacterota bacterium]